MPLDSVADSSMLSRLTLGACNIQESHETQLVMTNDDILGDKIPSDQEIAMRQFCYQTLRLPGGVRSLGISHFGFQVA